LSIDLSEQYGQGYEPTEQDWSAVEAEIADLRGKIERLGNVNLDAITEQEELEQRAGFLTSQRDDLLESKKTLESLIQRLNRESRERFVRNFEEIRKHFQELFRKLFGGGRADIILEDPNNVLECGIEIVARPPGKELQSISLLSGGEKTLTAVALLLGIFKSRPSPFAVLDEVDAALDEANNDRFNDVVREFLEHSQFVLITHSKRTMNVCDVMYGVTMQEPGVSKRVAVRFQSRVDEASAVA
jgi:chromosome segregation protein